MKNYKCVKILYIGECEFGFDFMMRLYLEWINFLVIIFYYKV